MRFKRQVEIDRRIRRRCFVSPQVCVAAVWLSVFLWLQCVTAGGYVCVRENPQRHKAPMPLCGCQQPPPHILTPSSRLWLGRSWGLTFHFSDPLFHRANSYAGLEMCYVAGWDKNQGQFQNNLRPPRLKVISVLYLCCLFIAMTSSPLWILPQTRTSFTFRGHLLLYRKRCLTNTVVQFSVLASIKIHLLFIT